MFKRIIGATLVFGMASVAPPVHAQAKCGPRDQIVERLGDKYNERMVSGGLSSATKLVEIWATEDGATWTILLTEATGRTCIMAAGKDWLDMPVEAAMGMGLKS